MRRCRMVLVSEMNADNDDANEARLVQMKERLRELDERLRSELRARGFDPDQGDNLALTAPLAKLYAERESLRVEVESLTERKF